MEKKEDDENLLLAKVDDKIKQALTRNRIENTGFLNLIEIAKVEKYLKSIKNNNYLFFGGNENCERKALIVFPDKFDMNMVEKNYNKIFSVIRINLPNELKEKYEQRVYLSGLIKLGITRDKIGDIIVTENGADIIVLKECEKYFLENLNNLTRFKKANISIINLEDLTKKENKYESLNIIVSSMRIDSFVKELAKTSREKANELLEAGRVFINYEEIYKSSRNVKENDIIVIRGKGKFIVGEIIRKTKNEKNVVNILKYI